MASDDQARERTVFTDEVLGAIPGWIRGGATAKDIAESLGTTENCLRVVCSRNTISLRRSYYLNGGVAAPDLISTLRQLLPEENWLAIEQEANQRRQPPVKLVVALLSNIAQDDLFNAVLDYDDTTSVATG